MKIIVSTFVLLLVCHLLKAQSVGIGTSTPHPSAALEINSINKGLLLPRVNDTGSISGAVKGLIIYSNADNKTWQYNGSRWQPLASQGGGADSNWYKAQDSIAFSKNKYVNINGDPGFMQPASNLQVSGSLLVHEAYQYTRATPTATQTYTMDNTSGTVTVPAGDSVFRIFDPGGVVNYNNNTQGNIFAGNVNGQVGYKLTFNQADFGVAAGDTLWISEVNYPACRQNNLFYITNRPFGLRELIINKQAVYFIFRSDNAATDKGFDIGVTRLFAGPRQFGSFTSAGSVFYFNSGDLAVGYNASVAGGSRNFAIGNNVSATGKGSGTIGFNATAKGSSAIAVGTGAAADGHYSLALGAGRTAGQGSLAFGDAAVSDGFGSVALGNGVKTPGAYAFATGLASMAKSYGSASLGMLNDTSDTPNPSIIGATDRILQVGNGTGGLRTNALTVLRNGNMGIGTVNPHALLQFSNTLANRKIVLWENANTDFDYFGFGINSGSMRYSVAPGANHAFFAGATPLFVVYADGNATLLGSLSQLSDERLKRNIEPLSNNLSRLIQLNGYTYYWKEEVRSKEQQIGVLAQEVQQLFPQLVHTDKEGTLSVNYTGLTPVLIEAVKELNQKIERQQQQINELLLLLKKQ
jgi:hypothetical protein